MGVLFKSYERPNKKWCTMCGCILEPKSQGHICECCLDELNEIDEEL